MVGMDECPTAAHRLYAVLAGAEVETQLNPFDFPCASAEAEAWEGPRPPFPAAPRITPLYHSFPMLFVCAGAEVEAREAAETAENARSAASEAASKAEVAKAAAQVAAKEAEKFSKADSLPPDAKVQVDEGCVGELGGLLLPSVGGLLLSSIGVHVLSRVLHVWVVVGVEEQGPRVSAFGSIMNRLEEICEENGKSVWRMVELSPPAETPEAAETAEATKDDAAVVLVKRVDIHPLVAIAMVKVSNACGPATCEAPKDDAAVVPVKG
eukprot:scaffold125448_cov16-Tisochrysis_lutea.AAC.1